MPGVAVHPRPHVVREGVQIVTRVSVEDILRRDQFMQNEFRCPLGECSDGDQVVALVDFDDTYGELDTADGCTAFA